jgi:hypothetical protein
MTNQATVLFVIAGLSIAWWIVASVGQRRLDRLERRAKIINDLSKQKDR